MKKILILFILFFCSIILFAQKEPIFFLYRGSMYLQHDSLVTPSIKKTMVSDGNVAFRIVGVDSSIHKLQYIAVTNKKDFLGLNKILLSKKVYYLNDLTQFDKMSCVDEFGNMGCKNSDVIVYIVPLLDIDTYTVPVYEVSFLSTFLTTKE